MAARNAIEQGHTTLGIELGSTRIKAVLTGPDHTVLATGSHVWENEFADGTWTYSLESVRAGLRDCYAGLAADVLRRHEVELRTTGALGISAMMHGYLAFDSQGSLLTPFLTWRNTGTAAAVGRLTEAFGLNIPHRWSIAHLYQAILDREEHLARLGHLTTLSGYVHWQLTGRQVLGIGDASGMFPIDVTAGDYDPRLVNRFEDLAAQHGYPLRLTELLPAVQVAGEQAGELTAAGAALLDPTGTLRPGITMCPPEGDAGTGMVATNSVAPRTGNISAGTSIFAMVVLERELTAVHHELDVVTTPAGDPVAMVHCNNGASELNAWAAIFAEFAAAQGIDLDDSAVFRTLLDAAMTGLPDGGGLMAFNYLSGEPIVGLEQGRPLLLRQPGSQFSLANFMRTQVMSAFATLRIGMDVLSASGAGSIDRMFAHGGLFKTEGPAQRLLAAAIGTPVSVGEVAADGGAWGIAVLAAFAVRRDRSENLAGFLNTHVFADARLDTVEPDPADTAGFTTFLRRFVAALPVEEAAVKHS